jgi:putative hemolysin
MNTLLQIPLILFLIFLNGVFAMAELAVMTSRRVRLQQRAEEGDRGAKAALRLNENPDRFLSTVQIGITLIGTLSSAVAGVGLSGRLAVFLTSIVPQIEPYAQQIALLIIVLIITYLSLVFGELVPKRLAISNSEKVASNIAPMMTLLEKFASPIVRLLSFSTEVVIRLIGLQKNDEPIVSEEEIRTMLQEGEQVGVFEETEADMVESVFRLGDRRVDSLMTPRTTIEWIDLNAAFDETLRQVLESAHTFFPVAEDNLDNVQGILSAKRLVATSLSGATGMTGPMIQEQIMPALFVPESMPAFKVLELLREASGNLALVIDEWGGVQGMVTLFDILEAIVGSIPDAGMPFEPQAVLREDGSWLLDGGMNIDEFKDLLKLSDLPEEDRAGYQTVAGFILTQLGHIPTAGNFFLWEGLRFEVVDMDGMRIDKVLVEREKDQETAQNE